MESARDQPVPVSAESLDFGRLFVQFQPCIHGYIRSLVADRHEAEEILQDTASVMWRKFDDFRPGSDFLAWALAVARFRVKEHWRRQRPMLLMDDAVAEAIADDTIALQARLGDMQDALACCLAKLTARDRELFQRRYAGEIEVAVLAEQVRRPVSTVYRILSRIRHDLLDCISRKLHGDDRLPRGAQA